MPATLTFDLPSKSACAPLLCGQGEYVTIQLRTASKAKSHDGSGFLIAPIATVHRLVGLTWRYTVTVPDSQIAAGATVTGDDVYPKLGCISLADAALFAKNSLASTPAAHWQVVTINVPLLSSSVSQFYLFRRATGYVIRAIEIGAFNLPAPLSVILQKTTAGGTLYTSAGTATAVNPPPKSARNTFASPIVVPGNCALALNATTTGGIYTGGATFDLHLFTTPN